MTEDSRVVLVVGGESEDSFFRAVLAQAHPWADLVDATVEIVLAKGDSAIPARVEQHLNLGHQVFVLYDRDALERAHEQTSVLRTKKVGIHELESDFEAAFDAEIVQRALQELNYNGELDCLQQARNASRTFAAIAKCAQAAVEAKPLSKVALAQAAAKVSAQTWYVPAEIYDLAIRLGEARGLKSFGGTAGWNESAIRALKASGRLYVSNHVSNDAVTYWDFDQGREGAIALRDTFDGRIAFCRNGKRLVLRKHERGDGGFPTSTQVFVMDSGDNDSLNCAHQFTMRGSVYDVATDEDGNHLELRIQDRHFEKRAIRCLADGTQREEVALPHGDYLYGARKSPNDQLMASGPIPLEITNQGKPIVSFPHFYALSYTWSPDARHLSFFGRRWGKHVKSQDFHWILDLSEGNRIHRVASGDRHMPTYWARTEK